MPSYQAAGNNKQPLAAFSDRSNAQRKRSSFNCFLLITNTILVIAVGVAVAVCVIFLHDEPLYEYGEQLLSLRFYRHIVYNCVVVPLALFVPIYYFLTSFYASNGAKHKLPQQTRQESTKLTVFKIAYAICVAFLVLVGLVFVFPSSRYSSVAVQLSAELRRHLHLRFQNDISYRFIDAIQRKYHCCDLRWFREMQMETKIPLSCYKQDGYYNQIYETDCTDTLASLVSNRCIVLSAALATILLMLIFLITVDIFRLVTDSVSPTRTYNVDEEEAKRHELNSMSLRGQTVDDSTEHHADSDDDDVVASPPHVEVDLEQRQRPPPANAEVGYQLSTSLKRNASPRTPSLHSVSSRFEPQSILKNNKANQSKRFEPSHSSTYDSRVRTQTAEKRFSADDNAASVSSFDNDFDNDDDSADNDVIDNVWPTAATAADPLLTRAHVFERPQPKAQAPTRFKTVSSTSTTTELFEEHRSQVLSASPKPALLQGLWHNSLSRSIPFLDSDDDSAQRRAAAATPEAAANEIGLPRVSCAYTLDNRATTPSLGRFASRNYSPSDPMSATRSPHAHCSTPTSSRAGSKTRSPFGPHT